MTNETNNVVWVRGVARAFGEHRALDGVDLAVPEGAVLGLLGRNGAGKTTLLQILLGMVRRDAGDVSVLGQDPAASERAVRAQVGYVPERPSFPANARVGDEVAFCRAFYPSWDTGEESRLRGWLGVRYEARIPQLSKGELAKLALLLALAHRPRLLVLDEPAGGLDPLVRAEVLEAIVDLVAEGGRTVILSSHLLEDVERVADHVAFLAGGRIRAAGPLEELLPRVKVVRIRTGAAGVPEGLAALPGVLSVTPLEQAVRLLVEDPDEPLLSALRETTKKEVEVTAATLKDLFRAYTGRKEVQA